MRVTIIQGIGFSGLRTGDDYLDHHGSLLLSRGTGHELVNGIRSR
jgi:hypothetical protein